MFLSAILVIMKSPQAKRKLTLTALSMNRKNQTTYQVSTNSQSEPKVQPLYTAMVVVQLNLRVISLKPQQTPKKRNPRLKKALTFSKK